MNSLKIESFLKIVEVGSINQAAEELFISQSTLSSRLASLEESLGATLIHRSQGTRAIELTDAGTEFINYAMRFTELMAEIEEWKFGSRKPPIHIASPVSLNSYFFKSFFLKQLNAQDYRTITNSQWNHITYQMIQKFELDIGFVSTPYFLKGVKTEVLFSEPMVLIYDSEESNYQDINVQDLPVESEIHLGWGPDYENWHNNLWPNNRHPLTSVDSPSLILEFLQTANSWAVVPLVIYDNFKDLRPSIKIINSKKMFDRKIYLVTQQSDNQAYLTKTNRFLAELKDHLSYMETAGFCELPRV